MVSPQRIGVIIHYSKTNYGNHLVNFATLNILQECGYQVDLLVLKESKPSRLDTLKRLPLKLRRLGINGVVSRLFGRLHRLSKSTPQAPTILGSESKRQKEFELFAAKFLQPIYIDETTIQNVPDAYPRIGIGSDQIWNYDYGLDGKLFANFTSPQRVITFSPSVGHKEIPTEWRSSYTKWLTGFEEVGVREIEWTRSLIPGNHLPQFTLLVDPTLMFDQKHWSSIATPSSAAEGKILLYHLGELLPQHADYVGELSNHHNLDVLHLSDTVGGTAWESNASDFLGMIEASSCVVTDSYHGAIFAFLFDKPLILLERHGFAGAMNTRTRTLTQRLDLTSRYLNSLSVKHALDHDYSCGRTALTRYRNEYWEYLQRRGIRRSVVADQKNQPN